MGYGSLTRRQQRQLKPYVEGCRIVDMGCGDLSMSILMVDLGASHVMSIDKVMTKTTVYRARDSARISVLQVDFEDLSDRFLEGETALLSWPMDLFDLDRLAACAKRIIYVGKNTDGIMCGSKTFWQKMLSRRLSLYEPDKINVLAVYTDVLKKPRNPIGEERAALAIPERTFSRRICMAKTDAEDVYEHLEEAKQAAKPLNDKDLVKKIEEVQKHVEKKLEGR
jgi:hypothetical protein